MAINPASLIVAAVMTGINLLVSATRTIHGPRLKDTAATVADYGTPLNYFIGRRVLPGHCFFSKSIREVKKKRKGKGGKRVEYSGFGTWASHIADHPIDAVEKIWFDSHLIYDNTGSGEKTYPLGSGYDLEANMRIYLGGEDQEPDPDMLAYIEARDGPGTCPAYRPTSYIYFENIPLEMIGNRFPSVTILVRNFPIPEPEPEGLLVSFDFVNGQYSVNGESRTLSQMIGEEADPPVADFIVPSLGLQLNPGTEEYESMAFIVSEEILALLEAGFTCVVEANLGPDVNPGGPDIWISMGQDDFDRNYIMSMGAIQISSMGVDGVIIDGEDEYDLADIALPENEVTKVSLTIVPGDRIAYSGDGSAPVVNTAQAVGLVGPVYVEVFSQCSNSFLLGPPLNELVIKAITFQSPVEDSELPGLSE